MFTRALLQILGGGAKVYAVDKSPHMLWDLARETKGQVVATEGDFNTPLGIPQVDGILMANALHYAVDAEAVLRNVLKHLKPGGTFVIVEYETIHPRPPWVPYPVPFDRFVELTALAGLQAPTQCGRIRSQYGYEFIYAAFASL